MQVMESIEGVLLDGGPWYGVLVGILGSLHPNISLVHNPMQPDEIREPDSKESSRGIIKLDMAARSHVRSW
jgi:hypothetical protein